MISGSLCNYYRDEIDNLDVNDNASDGKSFENKIKIEGKTPERPPQPENLGDAEQPTQPPVPSLNVEVTIAIKYLSDFWRSLDLPLMNRDLM